jgi:hypothetical protein
MSAEERIHQLLRAACREEREGNPYVAEGLRKMAAESLPAGGQQSLPTTECPDA